MKKILVILVIIAVTFSFFVGCNQTEEKEITIAYVNWAEGVAMTNLAAAILEDEYGYTVDLNLADPGPVYASLASGDSDVFLDAWLPLTHGDYVDEHGDNIEQLGVTYTTAKIGLVTPSYMDIDSITDLNDSGLEEIVGIDPGAGITAATDDAIEEYDLNLEQQTGGESTMTAALSDAIDDEEDIVVTGWAPHWKFAEWDLKFLDDPEGVYGEEENIEVYARNGFSTDEPELATFFDNFNFTTEEIADLMGTFEEAGEDADLVEVGRQWAEDNQDLVNSWLDE